MDLWIIDYEDDWDIYFNNLDKTIQSQILKKIQQLQYCISARHFHKLNFFILEVGQYRIDFFENKDKKFRIIAFIGNHKQYEKWYKSHR